MSFACAVLVLAVTTLTDAPPRQAVRVIVQAMDSAARAAEMSVIAEKRADDGRPTERLSAAVVEGQARLQVPAGSWAVSVQGKGLWSPSHPVDLESAKRGAIEVVVPVWRVGTVVGRLSSGSPASPLLLSFDRPPVGDSPPGPRESVACSVDAGQRFACEVPRGVHDLQLRTEGFVPRYYWDVHVAAGSSLEIPPVRLSSGASIAGFVGRPEGLQGPATVTLRTLDAETIEAKSDSGQFSAPVTGRRGFFQLAGVPPGEYLIQARLGDLVSVARHVTVQREAETWLREPLALSAPLTLDLVVDPPTAPGGGRWLVTLMHRDGQLSTPIAANVAISDNGTWRRAGLPAGTYRVGLSDRAGNRWALREFELPAAEPVSLVVQGRSIRGTVRLGKAPLEARLTFGRAGPVRVVLASDERGEFAGQLPIDDRPVDEWPVVVESSKPPLRRTLGGVRIPAESTDAVVDLVLPDTVLDVRIVDAGGNPWNERTVLTAIHDKDGPQQLLILPTDPVAASGDPDRGVVTFRGLSPGATRLVAESLTAASDEVLVEVKEDIPASAHLVMREILTVKGTVVSIDGNPIPGALLTAMPLLTPFQGMEEERSSGDGTFELRLPRGTLEIGMTIAAAGFAHQIARVPVRPGQEMRLVLRRSGGTLRLSLPGSVSFGPGGRALFLFRGGHLVNAIYLRRWAELNGGGHPEPETLVAPQMEAGPYALCLLGMDQVLPILARGSTPASCASGHLTEGGELSLAVAADGQ